MTRSPQVILITGSSSGFGFLSALHLARQGHCVYATMRDTRKGDHLLGDAARQGCARNIHILPLDVTKPASIRVAVNDIIADRGVIDVLVNNAGFGTGGFFEDLSPEDFQRQFDVNFFGVLNVTREVIPAMRPRRSGKIINISSMASFVGTPCFSAYCSSKWALEGFSECLYMEMKPFGVHVCLVEPGAYRTNIFDQNAVLAKNFNNSHSPYYNLSRHLFHLVRSSMGQNQRDPQKVAEAIGRIVESRSPAFRNIIGMSQKVRYRIVRALPFKIYAALVNRMLLKQA